MAKQEDGKPTPPATFDGLLNLNKPTGMTSASAVYRVRRLSGIRKSGHAGTLDPAADGVLLICMGRGTKRVESLMNLPKAYRAVGRLDVTSVSLDSDSPHQAVTVGRPPDLQQIESAAARLVGDIMQVPPQISALKVGGVPAYKRARRGQTVPLEPRAVRVYALTVEHYSWPDITFHVRCGRGTYVRALIRDIGAACNAGGCLTALTRTEVGPFNLENAATLEALEAGDFESQRLDLEALDALLSAG